ncbi:hypothetical protein EKK58_04485 [Candidatus Dependentiae bacterium]|nr:MAG: hypothetical protein EKK58_04485 [Candidatus Dependentiae bacterium]
MKYTISGKIFFVLVLFNVPFIFADDWQSNALAIQDLLRSLATTLLKDADAFDNVSTEIDYLATIVEQQDVAEQGLVKKLELQFSNLIQAYQDVLQKQQFVQVENAASLQQLKITLAALQSSIQSKLDKLNTEYDAAKSTFEQLTEQYNTAVVDNQQEAVDLLAILRLVCDNYQNMVEKKQLSIDELNELLSALNMHIQNATNSFAQLNKIINQ